MGIVRPVTSRGAGFSGQAFLDNLAQSSHREILRPVAEVGLPRLLNCDETPFLRSFSDWCGREDSNLHDLSATSS
jgi:hypothetical protein